jgi:integrase
MSPTTNSSAATPSPASHWTAPSSCDAFKRATERADVRRITFHELRHTFGTRMAAAGVPLRTIQHWMGHADAKTTQVYAHYQPSEAEVQVVDAAFAP